MMEMIENQAYLAQGAYAKGIGRSTGQLTVCEAMHYALVTLHIRIQTASAYEMLGKRSEAREVLERALRDAEPDELLLLFVENYRYLKDLLISCAEHNEFIQRIVQLGGAYEVKRKQIQNQTARPAALAPLMEREYEIVGLLAERLSNREIAEKLFLSECSIKQYINQIYTKLHIEGRRPNQEKTAVWAVLAKDLTFG